jgi:hypothetical protein
MLIQLLLLTTLVRADLPMATAEEWLAKGFQPIARPEPRSAKTGETVLPQGKLPWPVKFQDEKNTVANSMAQYQPFGDPYFHGGCDLRVAPRERVLASVSGKIEAGHYGYSKREDGSLQKFWRPWPQNGDALYFEVAIIDAGGIRHEYHHVDRASLPAEIQTLLNNGGGEVAAGTHLGNTIFWPGGGYHHIHLNLVTPGEVRLNPEFYSEPIPDSEPPQVFHIFALSPAGVSHFGEGNFLFRPTEFIVHSSDRKNSSVYENPPVVVSLTFLNGASFRWDFRERLWQNERFPVLREFFQFSLRTPEGKMLRTEGGYGTGKSLIRLPVPADGAGAFVIRVEDMAGNFREFSGSMP